MLDELKFEFSVIGLSEIKLKENQSFSANIEISGYNFISQPSLSNLGGVYFYVKIYLKFTVRDDLSKSREEFECLWIEVDNLSQPNILYSVVYRHPGASLENFARPHLVLS